MHEMRMTNVFLKSRNLTGVKKRYKKLLDIVDKEYTNSDSKRRAKEQMVERIPGSPSKKPHV
jgi:hypothetical protein